MQLHRPPISPRPLHEIAFASAQTRILLTAIQLEIFDKLDQSAKNADEVAQEMSGNAINTALFLDGLTALGLLEKIKGRYKNTLLSKTFLIKNSITYMGEGLMMQAAHATSGKFDLQEPLLNGPKEPTVVLGDSPERWGKMARNMANMQRSGTAQEMAALVSRLPEFPTFTKMLDLGGGPGMNCIAMVGSHSTMNGIVFDRKPSTDVAKEFIKEYNFEGRIGVLAGDYNTDDIGSGYDFVWSSFTLNFAQNGLKKVIKKIYDALNPGGVFINFSEGLTHEGTRPLSTVMSIVEWAMLDHSFKAFNQGQIANTILEVGFKSVRSRTLSTGWGEADMDIARKAV